MNNSVVVPAMMALVSIPCAVRAADSYQAKSFPASEIREVDVRTESGAITIAASDGSTATTEVSPAPVPGDDCRISVSLRGGRLTLAAQAAKARFSLGLGGRCSAGFTVSAPPRATIKAASGSGDVSLGAFSGKADVRTGSGSISVHGASGALVLRTGSGAISGSAPGKLDADTGSGGIDLNGLSAPLSARSGSGTINLTWAEPPRSGRIDVRTGSGDFNALFPSGTRLKVSAKSGSGSIHNDFDGDAKAPVTLEFRSGSGSATLKKLQ